MLSSCNETELLASAKRQGLGRLRRGMPREELISLIIGDIEIREVHLSASSNTRLMLAEFIHNPEEFPPSPKYSSNWGKIKSQLPGCNGVCHKFECTEGRHADCYSNNEYNVIRSR